MALMHTSSNSEHYPGLAELDYARRWLDGFTSIAENFLVSASSILLTLGIGASMFDFFTGGTAFGSGWLMFVWAFVQTLAVDTQFLLMAYKVKLAIRGRNWFAAIGYSSLVLLLGFVVFSTNAIPSLQLARNISFTGAITSLGLDATAIVYVRSFVLVILAIIAAFNRTVISFPAYERKKGKSNEPENNLSVPANLEQNTRSIPSTEDTGKVDVQPSGARETDTTTEPLAEPPCVPVSSVSVGPNTANKKEQIRVFLTQNPNATIADIMRETGVTKSYASTTRSQLVANRK